MPVYPLTAWKPSCTSPGCWCRDRVPRYPSDLDDAQWAVLEPQARAVMAELAITAGRPMVHDLRAMCDAVFYVVRNGIEWRALPADFPPWEAVYAFYQRWSARGLPQTLVHRLREKLRVHQGRDAQPTASIVDSQIVKAADTVPKASSGYHGGKKITGRGRHVAVDAEGWLLALVVTAASVSDRAGAKLLVIRLLDAFGWLMRYRRLARDYERLTAHHEAMVYWATIMIMTRRLARYQANQPPQQRWGGDRPQPAAA